MKPSVSAVIATIGRPSLTRAVQSALDQTYPVDEIIVVAEAGRAGRPFPLTTESCCCRSSDGGGPARSRQLGIDAARGSVIALLDDDDVWSPTKLARQLAVADSVDSDHWIVSSRMLVLGPGTRQRMWPRRLIKPGESVAEYLFRFNGLGFGNANLQTSTLCFPTDLGRCVRWGGASDVPHDEPSWLIRVQRTIPDLRVVQLPETLSIYNVHGTSVSRDPSDRTDTYIAVGIAVSGQRVAARARRLSVYQSGQRGGVRAIIGWVCGARFGRRYDMVGPAPSRWLMRLSTRPGSSCVRQSRPSGDDDEPGSSRARGASRAALRPALPHRRHARRRVAGAREHSDRRAGNR